MDGKKDFGFKPLEQDDLPQMLAWHNEPHVKAWYDHDKDLTTPEAIAAEYAPLLDGNDPTQAFIIEYENTPIGYIQTYHLKDNPEYASILQMGEQAAGMDLFIGDARYLHRGLGAKLIKQFLGEIVFAKPEIESCVIGPEPKNLSAIHAYEKAGFRYIKTVQIPGEPEPEYIMRIGRF